MTHRGIQLPVVALCFTALALGCGKTAQESAPPSAPVASRSSPSTSPPVRAEELSPIFQAVGQEGALPTELVFELARNVLDPAASGRRASERTRLALSPQVDGTLTFRRPSTLVFKPSRPLAFDTGYAVSLESVETEGGALKAPPAGWRFSFRTPPFGFVAGRLKTFDVAKRAVTTELVFSGPVDATQVKRFSVWQLDGAPVREVTVKSADEPEAVHVTLSDPGLKPGASLRLILKEGMPSRSGGAKAKPADWTTTIPEGKRIHIVSSHLREGANGFYVELRCEELEPNEAGSVASPDDDEYDHYYYDRTRRCDIDESAVLERVRVEPKTALSAGPGRSGFRVFGDFKRGSYTLKLKQGLVSRQGALLPQEYSTTFTVPARRPQLSFGASGRYLPRSAWRNLSVTSVNLDTAELIVRQVPPENLVFWLSDDANEAATERTSNVVYRKSVPLKNTPDAQVTSFIDVASALPGTTRGVLELTLQNGGIRSTSRLLLTDMSLVAKRTPAAPDAKVLETVWIWALGIESTELLSGVEVSLLKKSGKRVAHCTTSAAQGCKLEVPHDALDPSEPFALIARKGDDLTYLRYRDLKTDIAESDVQGEPYRASKPYRAAAYGDRGVYRPGETAHVVAIVRTNDDLAPPAGLPVQARVQDPRNRTLKREQLKTNAAGVVSLDLPFEPYADTGVYTVMFEVAERLIGQHTLNVEEFVPERMKVSVDTERSEYLLGSDISTLVEARYLFGGSAEGSKVEVSCRLEPAAFRPKENAQLAYGVWSPKAGKAMPLGQVEGTLDEKGQAALRCPAPTDTGGFRGPARLVAQAAVFEAGSGRSTQNDVSIPVHPERYYLGLQANVQQVQVGKPFTVSGAVVDWSGALAKEPPKTVEVEYLRLESEYGYYWDEDENTERYQRYLRPVREGRTSVPVQGSRFQLEITPQSASYGYLVRVRSGRAQTDLELEGPWRRGWYWYDGEQREQTPRPQRPTWLPIEAPQVAKVGQSLEVTVKAPFRGRMLLTAETDQVLAAEWREVDAGKVTWKTSVARFAPNVYVSAFLVKDPHLESKEAFMPDRAFGVASVPLEPEDFVQALTLKAPKEVRSNDTLSISLDLGKPEGPTFVTVAAVDEGILQLTKFKTPDPIAQLFSKRALGVETYETIGWTLLSAPQGNSRSTGGDGDGAPSGRVQPVKPVALWSGLLPVPPSGKVDVRFQVPQYRGQLRVMAVAVGPKRIGRASAQVVVRDPLTLQATMPRFLIYGDTVQIPVFLTNVSGKAREVTVALSTENIPLKGLSGSASEDSPLELLGKREGQVHLEDGKSATLVFQARATKSVGAARLKVTATSGELKSHEELEVPFQPAGPRERVVQRIELEEGTTSLTPHLSGWVPTTETTNVWVTSNPYGETFQHLRYLIQYPYGCIEQTTSSTRPMLFVSGLIENLEPGLSGEIEKYVDAGIRRLLSMQTPAGGFSYWPGNTEPVAWGTAYASHLLLDAQKAGFAVPKDRLDDALKWAEGELDRYEARTANRSGYYQDHGGDAEPYLQYLLAVAGRGRKGAIQRLIDETAARKPRTGQQEEHLYLLKAALYLAGDRRYERDLRNPDLSPVTEERINSWSFYSDRRRRGLMLSTFEDLFRGDSAGEPLAQLVAQSLTRPSGWYNTQELVWGVTGLGKRVGNVPGRFSVPKLVAAGKEVPLKTKGDQATPDRAWTLARASEYASLELTASKIEGRVFAILSSQGVRANAKWKTGGEGLTVKRRYRALDGKELDVVHAPMDLAQLAFVEIEVSNTSGERVQNLALVDRLPAGWEIENPRLGRGQKVDWVEDDALWQLDYLNVRDDRLEAFGALERGQTKKIVYAVRAVTSGSFTLPPVEVEAMYDPRLWARDDGGHVEIRGPWKDFLL